MPRCLMTKKWKTYPWTVEEKVQTALTAVDVPHEERKPIVDEEEDEEIDVVTIHQTTSAAPLLDVKPLRYDSPTHDENLPPPRSYYQASAEDYPCPERNSPGSECRVLSAVPSVIQQHTSHPTPQIRLTSVIHHSGSFLAQNGAASGELQPNGHQMHQSASPMQPQSVWGPSSPTEGATAPSPPPHIQHSSDSDITTTIHYNGYTSTADISHYSAYLPGESATSPSYATLQTPTESSRPPTTRTRSLAMCFTSTGAALSLPPKKKDIYRPYSLDDRPSVRWRPAEDLSAAHAILDLSASPPAPPPPPPASQPHPSPSEAVAPPAAASKPAPTKTIAYTYEAFFVSDGRSKKKTALAAPVNGAAASGCDQRPKYTCSECGKQYATSSNLSRHKQTHRSLDSQSAKKCVTCGKAYVSMPALAMHLLTHKLNHACGICGKLFSRPWLLQGHLRSHTGEKPYGCAHCGKAFADRSNLRAHMQTHSTDKNFECTRCHKTFALKSYLNKHLESACVGDADSNTAISNQVPTITHLR